MSKDGRAQWGSSEENPPLFGTELKTFSEEWNKYTERLRPTVAIEAKEEGVTPRVVSKVRPVRYGHAIRYELKEEVVYDINEQLIRPR